MHGKKLLLKSTSLLLTGILSISCIVKTSTNPSSVSADTNISVASDLAYSVDIAGLVKTWNYSASGWVDTTFTFMDPPFAPIAPEYKYLQLICSGDTNGLAPLRFHMFGIPYEEIGYFSFDPDSAYPHFLTADGSSVPKLTDDKQVIVIDLEASGVNTSMGFAGFHMFYDSNTPATVTIHDARFLQGSEPVLPPEIQLDGFQISTSAEGLRAIYSITDTKFSVTSAGLIYGLKDYVTEEDMIIDSPNEVVYQYEATDSGKFAEPVNDKFESSYAMTMRFGDVNPDFFTEDTLVRAYVQLDNGSYVYSEISKYNVFDVADTLYTDLKMNSASSHDFLYDTILSYVNTEYTKIEYTK